MHEQSQHGSTGETRGASFDAIERLQLCRGVTSTYEYSRRVEKGLAECKTFARGLKLLSEPSIDKIQDLHDTIFGEVYTWAGNFREPGRTVKFGGFEGAVSEYIKDELELLFVQTRWLLAGKEQDKIPLALTAAATIAFFHIRFERIHPFRDGNGRLGREIIAGQVYEAFSTIFPLGRDGAYMRAVKAANGGYLTPLTNLILPTGQSTDVVLQSPFRIRPHSFEERLSFHNKDELFWGSFVDR